jgi:voltage-gated potassium channel
VSERAEAMERRFHRPVIVATLLVIPVMILQGLDPGQPWSTIGYVGDSAIWLVFLAEVVAMLSVTADRWQWVRSNPLDVMIVVLTPPVAPAVLQSVRVLRLLRLVRLFRVARLVRGVFTIEGVRYAAFLAFVTLIVGAQAFVSSESDYDSIGQGLYWAIGTMTTAGSGDVVATTNETEAVGSVLMFVGLAFGAIITGAIAQRFIVTEHTVTQGNLETLAKQDATHAKLDAIAQRLDRLELAMTTPPANTDGGTAAE